MKKKMYVMLGDVISSRRIRDRENFQRKFEKLCKKINTQYNEDIFADFKILKGIDEIGGVLLNISNIYKIISTTFEQLYPNLIRFVLVFDYIDTGQDTKDITKMDGPVFHKATDIMKNLKKSKLMYNMSIADEIIDIAITGQINLILLFKNKWSENQHKIVIKYEKNKNQYEVAKDLRISQQAVSKILIRSKWKDIKGIEEKLNYILQAYSKKQKLRGDIS